MRSSGRRSGSVTLGGLELRPLEIEHRFGFSEPFSIGVEEELFLVDPLTGRQTNTAAAVLERLGDVEGTVEQELHACQVELITNIHSRRRRRRAGPRRHASCGASDGNGTSRIGHSPLGT